MECWRGHNGCGAAGAGSEGRVSPSSLHVGHFDAIRDRWHRRARLACTRYYYIGSFLVVSVEISSAVLQQSHATVPDGMLYVWAQHFATGGAFNLLLLLLLLLLLVLALVVLLVLN